MERGRVFISHSSSDALIAETYIGALESAGVPCWMAPRDIQPGMSWAEAIVKAIDSCSCFMIVFSRAADSSHHVQSEITRAVDAGRPIFLVRTDDTDPRANDTISLFLATHHWFDAEGIPEAQYLPRLVEDVRAVLEGSAAAGDRLSRAAVLEANDLSRIQAGIDLEHVGSWDEAAKRYENLLASTSERARCSARIRLARCLIETSNRGETDEARDVLEEAEEMTVVRADDALRGELRLQQGRLESLAGRVKHAIERFEEARVALAAAGADLTEIDLVLAAAERDRGEFNRSLARLERIAVDSLPSWLGAEYYDELGATLLARGEAPQAIEAIENGLSLDDATGTDYAGSRSKLLLAQAYMRTGAPDYAYELIQEAIAACRHDAATGRLSEAYAVLGGWYEDREDYAGAISAYLDSYELDRTSGDNRGAIRAKRFLARAFRKRGRSDRSRELLADAKELLTPDDDVERAAILCEEGHLALSGSDPDYDEAIRLFRAALTIAEDDGDERTIALAKRDLAAAYAADGKFDIAEGLLLEARAALEKRGDLHELDDLLDDLGELKLEADDYAEARVHVLASLEYDEKLGRVASKARSLLLLGRIESRSANQDAAGEHFEQACELYDRARNDVGLAEALKAFGAWQLAQGRIDPAVKSLQEALEIETRLGRRLGRVQAKRLLTAATRQRGSLDRAADYLEEARRDLEGIDDPTERALLDFEEARIEIALSDHSKARSLLNNAHATFVAEKSPVDAATCQRFLAQVAAYDGRYGEALALLEEARQVFESYGDEVETDELYDDLGVVHLLRGDTEAAAAAANHSLELGRSGSWRRGSGRSLFLLAKIAIANRDRIAAKRHLDDALEVYMRVGDDIGEAAVRIELGDWHESAGTPGPDLHDDKAVTEYKYARRLLQHHRNRRGVARCNRKLGLVYLDRGEIQRADEALADARAELGDVDDLRELAPLEFAFGQLATKRGSWDEAVDHLRQALDGFAALAQDQRRSETQRLLVHAYQAKGDVKAALDCIRQIEAERVSMYTVLVDEFDDVVVRAAAASFANGAYATAVDLAFGELEREFRRRVAELGGEVPTRAVVTEHVEAWGDLAPTGSPFLDRDAIVTFARFCSATFDVVRSAAYRSLAEQPAEAFAALSMAHWIARSLDTLHTERAIEGPGAALARP